MSELLRIQRALQNYLVQSCNACEITAPCSVADIESHIVETECVPRATRLNIYANTYKARIVESLSVDFNGLHAYLGDEGFMTVVGAYIGRYPSRYFSLRHVGTNLCEFLKGTQPYADHVEVYELAMFEWALCHAFDAAAAECADAAYFSALPSQQWPQMTLQFVPSLQVIAMRSNAAAIWKSLNNEQAPPAVMIAADERSWFVWRNELNILFRPLDEIEKIAFDIFFDGRTFAEVCESLAEVLPEHEVPSRAVAILQQWLSDRLITTP